MNMLFWVWYSKYKEQIEEQDNEDDDSISLSDIDSLIPSPLYFFIGILVGAGLLFVSYIILKLFII